MHPAKLGKLGSRTQWIQLSRQWTQQTQLKPGFLFVLMNPAKLGKLGSRTQLTWVNPTSR